MGVGRRDRQSILLHNAISHFAMRGGFVQQDIVAGNAAPGNFTVPGIEPPGVPNGGPGDRLVMVAFHNDLAGTLTDLTPEFTINAPNTINNGGGTPTGDGVLLITWEDRTLPGVPVPPP